MDTSTHSLGGQLAVGDKVAAYNSVEMKWREVIIREVNDDEVYVICLEDGKVEDFSVKMTAIRLLNKVSVKSLNIAYDEVKESEGKVFSEKVKVDMKALTLSVREMKISASLPGQEKGHGTFNLWCLQRTENCARKWCLPFYLSTPSG